MCRSDGEGGRRCPGPEDATLLALVNPRRRARDNRRLAARARAAGRKSDAERYERHAAKADSAALAIRDAVPPGPVHATERRSIRTARDQKALLASLAAEGVTDDSSYRKLVRTVSTGKNDEVIIARDLRGRPIGIIGYRIIGKLDIYDLWIIDDAQRSGAGTELLAQAAVHATHVGPRRDVGMSVSSALADAKAFYAKHGAAFNGDSQSGSWREPHDVAELAAKARLADRAPRDLPSRADFIDAGFRREITYAKRLIRSEGQLPDWYTNPASRGSLWINLTRLGDFSDDEVRERLAKGGVPLPAGAETRAAA